MRALQVKAPGKSGKSPAGWHYAWRFMVVLAVTLVLSTVLTRSVRTLDANGGTAGFGRGLLHGALMPCALPSLLLGREVTIYAPRNDGRPYKLGYTSGVNACGALFFGILYWRFNRWRKR